VKGRNKFCENYEKNSKEGLVEIHEKEKAAFAPAKELVAQAFRQLVFSGCHNDKAELVFLVIMRLLIELKPEHGAVAYLALDTIFCTMHVQYAFHDGQAKPGANNGTLMVL